MTTQSDPALTQEERAQVLEIQDQLIELYARHGAAVTAGDAGRAASLQGEIDELLGQRDSIKIAATSDGR